MIKRSILIAAMIVAIGLVLTIFDTALIRAFHVLVPSIPVLDTLAELAKKSLDLITVAIFILLYIALIRVDRLKRFYILAGTMLAQGIVVSVMKDFFSKMRPADAGGLVVFTGPAMHDAYNSFPGGHAAAAFALAAVLATWHPRFKVPLYIFAVLVCLSRIYLDRHFFSDCFIGGALGYYIACATQSLLSRGDTVPFESRM